MKTAPATTLEQWLTSILRHMETDPGYLDTLPQLPQVILKKTRLLHASGVGKPFLMRWRFSVDALEGEAEAWPFLRMTAWMEILSGNCWNAPSKS